MNLVFLEGKKNGTTRPTGMRLYARAPNAHPAGACQRIGCYRYQRPCARCGWLRLPWPLRYARCTLTGSSGEGRRNGLIPRALEMVVVLTLLGNFLEPEAQ